LKLVEPTEYDWYKDSSVQCGISIEDSGGSGVLTSSIEYAISTSGIEGFGEWSNKSIDIEKLEDGTGTRTTTTRADEIDNDDLNQTANGDVYKISVTPTFDVGTDNYIIWRGTDIAKNQLVTSEPQRINIDNQPVIYMGMTPKESITNPQPELLCMINMEDLGGSGIDPDTVEYKYSTTGFYGFSDWTNAGVNEFDRNSFFVYLEFLEGSDNHIYWRAGDIAGNNISESKVYNITVNSPPEAMIDSPGDQEKFSNVDKISFDASSTVDPDFSDKLKYTWSSNISKIIGERRKFTISLSPGVHNITLLVTDAVGHTDSQTIQLTIERYIAPPDDDDVEPTDDGGEKLAENNDIIIITGIIIVIIICLVLFNLIKKRRADKKKLEEDTKDLADTKPAVTKSSVAIQSANIQDGALASGAGMPTQPMPLQPMPMQMPPQMPPMQFQAQMPPMQFQQTMHMQMPMQPPQPMPPMQPIPPAPMPMQPQRQKGKMKK
jgi:hypothetical protein